jgi:acetylornithine/succinyldiaminopimelate/putrescine aminotransferase/predicted amino acid dehydrogenase
MKPADTLFGPNPSGSPGSSAQRRHFAVRLSGLLRAVGLDVAYERAAGDWLIHRGPDGRPVRVLDMVGGYGVLLLGHNHPALVAEAQRLLASGVPIHVQGSDRPTAERLARTLSARAGDDYRVVFANTGAEAVEAAMKHAMLQTGSRLFVALEGGFHGKTLGAIQLTANTAHREPFELDGVRVLRVQPNDVAGLDAAFAEADGMQASTPHPSACPLAGFVFEPIQGEGGVRPLDAVFVQRAAELCSRRGVPMIADECQTGVGRTGTFLACHALAVQPDYVTLSKALGGGLANTSALLIRRSCYIDAFDLKHTSTFAGDGYSCAIAAKALELIDDDAMARCRKVGGRLLERLRAVQASYPDVIADVRGRGLMLGVELRRQSRSPSYVLRHLSGQDELAILLAGYFLNVHSVRIAATLSDPFTLRLQPSIHLDDEAIDLLITALQDVCARLRRGDGPGLTAFLAQPPRTACDDAVALRDDWTPSSYDPALPATRPRRAGPMRRGRVAWLCHLIDADDLASLDPAFTRLAFHERDAWLDRLAPLASPVLMNEVAVRSRRGGSVTLCPIMLPVTSRWMKRWIDARWFKELTNVVRKGVDMARGLGCDMVALGQYTSIATLNGTLLGDSGLGVTTGNSYAIGLAIEAIERAQIERGVAPGAATLAIIGAAGNIGRACAQILAPRYARVLLVGTSGADSIARLNQLAGAIPNAQVSTDPACVAAADVVLAATNAVDAPLRPNHFRPDAIVCDLSVPAAVDQSVRHARPDLLVIKGGIARLPHGEDLGIVGFPLPPGHTYGCMAESLLLGLEGVGDSTFTGSLRAEHVRRVLAMADRHGFELADYKTSCVLGGERRELAHACA